jgi:hypothetical protein
MGFVDLYTSLNVIVAAVCYPITNRRADGKTPKT